MQMIQPITVQPTARLARKIFCRQGWARRQASRLGRK